MTPNKVSFYYNEGGDKNVTPDKFVTPCKEKKQKKEITLSTVNNNIII